MRFLCWIEEGSPNRIWLCSLNRDTGELVPANGQGVLVTETGSTGAPQWGQDSSGYFLVTLDGSGRLVLARPTLNPDGTADASLTVLATAANPTRAFPYPSRVSNSPGYLVYQQADSNNPPRQQLWYLNLASPTLEFPITQGPVASIGQFGLPPFLVNIQRWFYRLESNGDGLPVVAFGNADAASAVPRVRVEQLDLSAAPPTSSQISGTNPALLDPFPFLYQGERYLIAGVNATATGGVFARDGQGSYSVQINSIRPDSSSLLQPSNFASCEPFLYKQKVYSAFQVNEPGAPGTGNGEIWLTSVFDNSLLRKISGEGLSRRADPEFFIGNSKVWVYYYARLQNFGKWQLHRVETGL